MTDMEALYKDLVARLATERDDLARANEALVVVVTGPEKEDIFTWKGSEAYASWMADRARDLLPDATVFVETDTPVIGSLADAADMLLALRDELAQGDGEAA